MDGEEEEEQRWVGEVGGGGRWRRSGSCAMRNGDVLLWIRDTQWAVIALGGNMVPVAFINQLYRLEAAGCRRVGRLEKGSVQMRVPGSMVILLIEVWDLW